MHLQPLFDYPNIDEFDEAASELEWRMGSNVIR